MLRCLQGGMANEHDKPIKITYDASRIAEILSRRNSATNEQDSLSEFEQKLEDTEPSAETVRHTAKLVFEYGTAYQGHIQVVFGEEADNSDKIIFFPGDNTLDTFEEQAIRRTTGAALNCTDELGDYQHLIISEKELSDITREEAPREILEVLTARPPPFFKSLFFAQMYTTAIREMGAEMFSHESVKMLVEALPLLGYQPSDINTLLKTIQGGKLRVRSSQEYGDNSADISFVDAPWKLDYNNASHRVALFPTITAIRADLNEDSSERGLYRGLLTVRYKNIPQAPTAELLAEDNAFRNLYRKFTTVAFKDDLWKELALNKPEAESRLYDGFESLRKKRKLDDAQFERMRMLVLSNLMSMFQDAQVYADCYRDAPRVDINHGTRLFYASNRLWRGMFDDGGHITRGMKELIPYLVGMIQKK